MNERLEASLRARAAPGWKATGAPIDKRFLANIIQHTDSHNNCVERERMWEKHRLEQALHGDGHAAPALIGAPRAHPPVPASMGNGSHDRVPDWTPAAAASRWGHDGFEAHHSLLPLQRPAMPLQGRAYQSSGREGGDGSSSDGSSSDGSSSSSSSSYERAKKKKAHHKKLHSSKKKSLKKDTKKKKVKRKKEHKKHKKASKHKKKDKGDRKHD